eukprot:7748624-Pyramimonas_sp.AAC.1
MSEAQVFDRGRFSLGRRPCSHISRSSRTDHGQCRVISTLLLIPPPPPPPLLLPSPHPPPPSSSAASPP